MKGAYGSPSFFSCWLWLFSTAFALSTSVLAYSEERETQPHPPPLVSGRWWLVASLQGSSSQAVGRAVYIDLLARRFQNRGFSALVVLEKDGLDLKAQLASRRLDLSIVSSREVLQQNLDGGSQPDQVWLLDPAGRVHFRANGHLLLDDDLRQVVEKALLGQVSHFEPGAERPLLPGDRLPDLWVYDTLTGQRLRLHSSTERQLQRIAFFTPKCPRCGIGTEMEILASARPLLEAAGKPSAAIFSSRFSVAEIAARVALLGIKIPVFVAEEELTGLEDLYYERHLISETVLLDCDAQGTIEDVVPLSEFLVLQNSKALPQGDQP